METLGVIFDGLNNIASTYFSNTSAGIQNQALQNQNQALIQQLNQNNSGRTITTVATLGIAAVILILIIKK